MNQDILNKLNKFMPISLAEMDGVKLMDRTDTKFIFNIAHLSEILEEATNYYKILHCITNTIVVN